MRVGRLIGDSIAILGLLLASACSAGVPFPEWKAVNAPRALELGTEEALIEALEAKVDEDSTGSLFATRVGRAEHLLWLLLREGGAQNVLGAWKNDVRWDLVERIRRIEPQAREGLGLRLEAGIRGQGPVFGFAKGAPNLDQFFADDLMRTARNCPECVQAWVRKDYPINEVMMAASRGHTKTLKTLFDILGPEASRALCATQHWSGGGAMDAVRDGDVATRELLASYGAREYSEEEETEQRSEIRQRNRAEEARRVRETLEAERERAANRQREAEEHRREQAAERRRQDEWNADAGRAEGRTPAIILNTEAPPVHKDSKEWTPPRDTPSPPTGPSGPLPCTRNPNSGCCDDDPTTSCDKAK